MYSSLNTVLVLIRSTLVDEPPFSVMVQCFIRISQVTTFPNSTCTGTRTWLFCLTIKSKPSQNKRVSCLYIQLFNVSTPAPTLCFWGLSITFDLCLIIVWRVHETNNVNKSAVPIPIVSNRECPISIYNYIMSLSLPPPPLCRPLSSHLTGGYRCAQVGAQ